MGKVGKRTGNLLSERCAFKNLLKYGSSASWELDDHKLLVANLVNTFITKATKRQKGWISLYFGDALLLDNKATNEILLLLLALLAHECKEDTVLVNRLLFSWDKTLFLEHFYSNRPLSLARYLAAESDKDLQLNRCTIEELSTGFENPQSLVLLIGYHPQNGELRQRWFKDSKKQLKPVETKVFRLLACLLLGAPDSLHLESSNGVSVLLMQAFGVKQNTIKKHISEYWKVNQWLATDLQVNSMEPINQPWVTTEATPRQPSAIKQLSHALFRSIGCASDPKIQV